MSGPGVLVADVDANLVHDIAVLARHAQLGGVVAAVAQRVGGAGVEYVVVKSAQGRVVKSVLAGGAHADDIVGILVGHAGGKAGIGAAVLVVKVERALQVERPFRSEEHTSELQSRGHLVCRLLLEKKK